MALTLWFQPDRIEWVYLFHRARRRELPELATDSGRHGPVARVNERHVVERVIDAVAALDWPRDKLHIQVLDDSTDETTGLARARADFHRPHGIDITVHHRADRTGYKAGALQAGLECSTSPFVAIFDADFVPPPDFLKRMMPALWTARRRLGASALDTPQRGLFAPHLCDGPADGCALCRRASRRATAADSR